MLERFGIEKRDIRNLQIIFIIMTLVMAFLIDAPIFPRLVAGSMMGLLSATAFLVVTIILKKVAPEYY